MGQAVNFWYSGQLQVNKIIQISNINHISLTLQVLKTMDIQHFDNEAKSNNSTVSPY